MKQHNLDVVVGGRLPRVALDSPNDYTTGAFLLAGSEVLKL